jgi:glycosyltransferase involved in cell wall biosynthesis
MRIAHITATFPPYWGGTGNVCYYNTRELARLGHEVHVYTPKIIKAESVDFVDGVYVHRVQPLIRFGNASLLPRLLYLQNFNIIHFHYPFFGGEFSVFAAYKQNIPIIITYHQDVHLQGILNYVERFIRKTLSKWILIHADKVFFTSSDYCQASYARNIMNGRDNQMGVLSNGVDPEHFCPGIIDPLYIKKYKYSHDDKIALVVARLDQAHYFKGIPIFLEALSRLSQSIKAIIIGDGNLKNEYINLAKSLDIQNRVFFTGEVPIDNLPNYYRMADVTILPSTTMGEAFGLVLIESLACGTPVITSNLPGVRTIVSNGEDGYLVRPGDVDDLCKKIKQILSLPDRQRDTMGAAGRNKVEQKYTWKKAGQQLESAYHQILSTI